MDQNPFISIIVRTKDRPELLNKAIQSIAGQTFRPAEVVLVNDGGCDLDIDALRHILNDIDLHYIRLEENTGRAHAGNAGIEHARGNYIGFLDDDDELYPEHLSALTEEIIKHDSKVVYSDASIVYRVGGVEVLEGEQRGRKIFSSKDFSYSDLLLDNYIPLMCLLFSKDVFEYVTGFDESFDIYEDWDLLIRLAEKYPFHHVKKTTADYIQWSGTQQVAHSPEFAVKARIAHRQIINKHKDKFSAEVIMEFIQVARKVRLLYENGAEAYIANLENTISQKEKELLQLELVLDQITHSRGWKMMTGYYQVRDKVLPPTSRRRLLYDLFLIAGGNPKKFLGGLNKHNVTRFIQQYRVLDPAIVKSKVIRKTSINMPSGKPLECMIKDTALHEGGIFDSAKPVPLPREDNCVLVIDRFIPTHDKDSGSLRMYLLLKILRALGYRVTFLPDDLRRSEPYAEELERMGIEILSGNLDIQKYLEEKGSVFAFVIVSRPEQTYKYLPLIRAYALNSIIVYDTVDLHWVRFERAAAINGSRELQEKAKHYKAMELFNASCSDVVFTVTGDEKKLLMREIPDLRVEIVPNVHQVIQRVKPFHERKDIMFIGSFLHQPNEDAVQFFVREIFPSIKKRIPDAKFFVVGSDPLESILKLGSDTIKVTGYVKDVSPFFENCRVFVAPLRYGAGMKGKIGQSMAYGLPVVTTMIGAEGIGLVNNENALIADEPAEFADSVLRLYSDEELWNRISRDSIAHIEKNYSQETIGKKMAEMLHALKSSKNVRAGVAAAGK